MSLRSLGVPLVLIFSLIAATKALSLPDQSSRLMQHSNRKNEYGQFAILQGATDAHSTQIAVLVGIGMPNVYKLIDSNGTIYWPQQVNRRTRLFSQWAIDKVTFESLPSESIFNLEIRDPIGNLLDRRQLKTFPETPGTVRLALASCMSDAPIFDHEKIWHSLQRENPDALFFLGDNVYASVKDPINPEEMWNRYWQTRLRLPIFRAEKLTPIFATWDDHDFGQNNGDKTYKYVREAQEIFNDFFAQDPIFGTLEKGPGISMNLHLFGQHFLFMDSRSFRDVPLGYSMWGTEQEHWLQNQLKSSHKPLWIINGSQIFGKYGPSESLEKDFPQLFERLVDWIRNTERPVKFVSGDIHATEVMALSSELLNQTTVEITSSSMHSMHSPIGALRPNPRRIAGFDDDNFVIVTFNGLQDADPVVIQSFDRQQNKVFELSY